MADFILPCNNSIEVQGSRRKKRKTEPEAPKAKAKKRWADCVKDDLRNKGLSLSGIDILKCLLKYQTRIQA